MIKRHLSSKIRNSLMKRLVSIFTAFAFILLFNGGAFAQDVTVSANVLTEITSTVNNSVSFGEIQQNSSPNIDPTGSNTDAPNGTHGKITVTAQSSTQLIVDWDQTTVTLGDGSSTPNTMDFSPSVYGNSTDNASGASSITKGTASTATATSSGGNLYIYVGGSLTVASSQTTGTYTSASADGGSGPLSFTITYN